MATADVIVIGLGPGGEDLAGRLAEAGLDVIAIEKNLVGGECPYWGCVPTKMMVRAAHLLAEARRIPVLAGDATVTPDWAPVARRIREDATDHWNDKVAVERLERKGGRLVRGAARFTSPRTVEVNGEEYEARRGIVVATGTAPVVPSIDGLAETPFWTNHEAVEVEDLPASLVVLGGGPVGVEFAQVFARFGVDVTMIELRGGLMRMEEPEAGELLEQVFEREGINVRTDAKATGVEYGPEGFTVSLADGSSVSADRLLVATGRMADLAALGVGAAGLDETARFIDVDERLRAGDRLWAIGDVTSKGRFTHVAVYQARIAAADILGQPVAPAEYSALPRVTFTDPEIGAAGLTEQQARERGIDVVLGCSQIPSSARGWIHNAGNEGFIKLVADRRRNVLVGATAAGPSGGEVLGMLTLAIKANVSLDTLREMIYAYPTFHRAVEDALRNMESE